MKLNINDTDIDVNYIEYGNKKGKPIVLLHGWGQNIEMMKPIGDRLQEKYNIIIIDLPRFGDSPEPKRGLDIYDYNKVVEEVLNNLKINNPTMIGHSFGGRISIIYASRNQVDKVILFGSPCVRKEKKLSLKVRTLKALKKVPVLNKLEGFAKKHIGSRDYRAASPIMRDILVKTVNEDLSMCAKNITAPTLLIWGENDYEVTIDEAKETESLIKDSALIVLPNSTHYAYLENINQVINIINEFI